MKNEQTLAAFTFQPAGGEAVTLRAVQIDGSPWFVAADVCRAVGLSLFKGTTAHLSKLAPDERRREVPAECAPKSAWGASGRGGFRPEVWASFISESGLYKLILRSDKPQARAFQDWVTREVLPAIRKDGAYVMGEEKVRTGEMSEDEFVLKAVDILQRKVARITEERDAAVRKVEALEPRAAIVDAAFADHRPTLNAFARTLDGVNLTALPAALALMGFLHRASFRNGTAVYRVNGEHRGVLFTEKHHVKEGWVTVFPTVAGQERLSPPEEVLR